MMDAVKRSRFATKQMRAGPAPLASFEDLPSDELESPEDFPQGKSYTCNLDDESESHDLQLTTPDSLTMSSQSTPRIESDFDSQFTLTPGDSYQGESTTELRTASLSSLSKEDSTISIKQKKGSAVSLGTLETNEVEYTYRKSSWTDIFRSHNQNSAKTSSTTASSPNLKEKSSQKKSRTDYSKKSSDAKSKEKGKFLSIFKKKSNKQISSPLSPEYILSSEHPNPSECLDDLPEDILTNKVSSNKISKGKENESPVNKKNESPVNKENESPVNKENESPVNKENESPVDKKENLIPLPCETQNDLGKVNSDSCDKIPDERRFNRKVINIPEKVVENEYNIITRPVEETNIDKVSKTDNIEVVVGMKEDLESSESELTFQLKEAITEEKREDDFEAEVLLPHDLSEIEEEPVIEIPVTIEVSKQLIIPSKQQRLEVITKPIDRPRSTTPINVAPLEAFIQSVSPTFDAKVEKIKLSLPGEQFLGRVKSPKKSSVKSWTDFCERGLHSPRMYKRFDRDDEKNAFESSSDGAHMSDSTQFSSENWAAFETDFTNVDSNVFDDNFEANFSSSDPAPNNLCKPYQYFESDFSFNPSSSEFSVYGCALCTKLDISSFSDAQSKDQPASSACEGCSCQCHLKQKPDLKSHEHCSSIGAFGASKIFSLVTDEQF